MRVRTQFFTDKAVSTIRAIVLIVACMSMVTMAISTPAHAQNLDQDNDGILDTDEGLTPAGQNFLYNSSFEILDDAAATMNGPFFGGGFGQFGLAIDGWDLVSGTAEVFVSPGSTTQSGFAVAPFNLATVFPFSGADAGPSDGLIYGGLHSGDGAPDLPTSQADARETIINNLSLTLQPGVEYTLKIDIFQADGLVGTSNRFGNPREFSGVELYTIDLGAVPNAGTAYQDSNVVGSLATNPGANGIKFISLSADVNADGSAGSGTAENGKQGYETLTFTFTPTTQIDRFIFTPESGRNIYYVIDNLRLFATTQNTSTDTDGDTIGDHLDLDSDNDGISDLIESGQDASIVDTDNDGVHDGGVDGNGVPIAAGGGVTPVDTDNDTVNDVIDLDSDADGIPDAVEALATAGYVSSGHAGNAANNGVNDDGLYVPVNSDSAADGADYIDTDSDDDTLLDSAESGLTPGADGNGDGIGDGINAAYADPDGDINNPSADLSNQLGDTSEVGYREIILPDLDLTLTKTASTLTPAIGESVTYTLTVTNNGAAPATNTAVSDILPAGVTYVSDDSGGTQGAPVDYDPGNGVWTIASIASASSATLDIIVTVEATGDLTNRAEIIAADLPDPDSDVTESFDVDDLNDGLPDDDEAELTLVRTGLTVSGHVFLDNGIGAGASAHNGLIEGSEAGLGGVSVEALQGGNVIASAQADGDGNYTLVLPTGSAGTAVTLRVTGVDAAYTHISGTPGALPVLTDPDATDGTLDFVPARRRHLYKCGLWFG